MKIVIVEDEKPAVERLELLLKKTYPDAEVVQVLDSVESSVNWFNSACVGFISPAVSVSIWFVA